MILCVGLRRFIRRSPVGRSYQTQNPFSRNKVQRCFVSSRNNQTLIFPASLRAGFSRRNFLFRYRAFQSESACSYKLIHLLKPETLLLQVVILEDRLHLRAKAKSLHRAFYIRERALINSLHSPSPARTCRTSKALHALASPKRKPCVV